MSALSARRDLDSHLLSIDWTQNDWRGFDWSQISAQIPTLRTATVHALAEQHRRTRADEFSPIHVEQLRRLRINGEGPPGTPGVKPLVQYFVTPTAVDMGDTFSGSYGPAPPEAMFEGKTTNAFTASVIMDVAIAAMRASGMSVDPHAADQRKLLEDPTNRHKYDVTLLDDIKAELARCINSSGLVTTIKSQAETSVGHQADIKAATIAEYGVDPEDPTGSPSRMRFPKASEDEAQRYYTDSINPGLPLSGSGFTWEYLQRRCNAVRADVTARGTFDARTTQEICDRHDGLFKLAWFKAKRDLFHIFIPGMRPRYRAWSVAQWKKEVTDATQVPWYNVGRASYTPKPIGFDGVTPFPEEFYKWFYGRVYTPVFPIDAVTTIRLRDRLDWLSNGLRRKFRIHKEMPALELGTTVNIGHTAGFNILELKKLVTMWVHLEGSFATLHRRNRFDRNNTGEHAIWTGGASILEYTRLGAACRFAEDPLRNTFYPYMNVFPTVSQKTWDHVIEGEMFYWVPASWFEALSRPVQLFVHAVWAFQSIEGLTGALEPRWPNTRTSMRLRCSGFRRTGLPEDNYPQTVEFAGMQQSIDPTHITMWTVTCAAFCHFCCQNNREDYRALLTDSDEVLRKINVPEEARTYFKQFFAKGNQYYEPLDPNVNWDDPFYKIPGPNDV